MTLPEDALGIGAGLGVVLVVAPAAGRVSLVLSVAVALTVGLGVALVVVVAVGVVVASAMACEGPSGVNKSATETTRATETVGYATTGRKRKWRAMSLFMRFTGDSLGLLIVVEKTSGGPVNRATRSPKTLSTRSVLLYLL